MIDAPANRQISQTMSSSDVAVSVRGLSKAYTITHGQEKHITLAETILSRLKNPLSSQKNETFWALKDVNFDIRKGDVVGIIGRNGAGKSTLLKILSRITEPTSGQIDLYGRVGSLLEVGTGFHPELTGRENIFLNGAILGMTKAETRKRFDAIVDFAGVETFLDTPVKKYSSGMYVRLAFAVAAHLDPDILIVDEVLAVGDADFQRKCVGKMRDVTRQGKTVIVVSHQLETVSSLCDRAILMDQGALVRDGVTSEIISLYIERGHEHSRVTMSGEYAANQITMTLPKGTHFLPEGCKSLRATAALDSSPDQPWFISGLIRNEKGAVVQQFDSRLVGQWFFRRTDACVDIDIRSPWLKPGQYTVDAYVYVEGKVLVEHISAAAFRVLPQLPFEHATDLGAAWHAPTLTDFSMEPHEGPS